MYATKFRREVNHVIENDTIKFKRQGTPLGRYLDYSSNKYYNVISTVVVEYKIKNYYGLSSNIEHQVESATVKVDEKSVYEQDGVIKPSNKNKIRDYD